MIQGTSENVYTWDHPVIDELSKHFKTVIFDKRGVGRSDKLEGDLTVEIMAANLLGLMDALNINQAHILGHSLGGMIAQELALNNPERIKKLVLCSTTCGGSKAEMPSMATQSIMGRLASRGHTKLLVKKAMPHTFSKKFIDENPEFIEKKTNDFLIMPTEPPTFQAHIAAWGRYNSCRKLKNIDIPTLIMHGTDDKFIPLEDAYFLDEKIPNSKLIILEGFGHGSILIEDAEKVNNLIWNFIQEH